MAVVMAGYPKKAPHSLEAKENRWLVI